jgi:hypothetical protein
MAHLPADFVWGPDELRIEKVDRIGNDIAIEGYVHDVYGNHRARRKN